MSQGDLVGRMIGAASLSVDTFEEVEADETATGQAAVVVAMVAVAAAIGTSGQGFGAALLSPLAALLGWVVWAGVTFFIGTKLFGGTATWGELLRTLGFASAPGILLLVAALPLVGFFVNLLVPLWMLVAGIIAIRQALDFTTGKAILTAVVGWLALFIPRLILGG
ncbi:YIP1 family protein [Gemmatimonadota bacterium]